MVRKIPVACVIQEYEDDIGPIQRLPYLGMQSMQNKEQSEAPCQSGEPQKKGPLLARKG